MTEDKVANFARILKMNTLRHRNFDDEPISRFFKAFSFPNTICPLLLEWKSNFTSFRRKSRQKVASGKLISILITTSFYGIASVHHFEKRVSDSAEYFKQVSKCISIPLNWYVDKTIHLTNKPKDSKYSFLLCFHRINL